jgi:hypothetical protein
MILSFSNIGFEHRIKNGIKTTTIREDAFDRWKPGRTIHFWFRNPRNILASPPPRQFGAGQCVRVDKIEIIHIPEVYLPLIIVNGLELSQGAIASLAYEDGFATLEDFLLWFDKDFSGKIIHFDFDQVLIPTS